MHSRSAIAKRLGLTTGVVEYNLQTIRRKMRVKASVPGTRRDKAGVVLAALGRGIIRVDELDEVNPAWYPPRLEAMARALVRELDGRRREPVRESARFWEPYRWLTP
jgi:hypothetical protein